MLTDFLAVTSLSQDEDLPAWSSDGRIAFQEYSESNQTFELYDMNSDGSGLRQLTNDAFGVKGPHGRLTIKESSFTGMAPWQQ